MSTDIKAHPVLIDGEWRDATDKVSFQATNPQTRETLEDGYSFSTWQEIDAALVAATNAFRELQGMPRQAIADFLRKYADKIEKRADDIVAAANLETALPVEPRLKNVELPRTCGQLRQAADACVDDSWRLPVVDENANIRSVLQPLGPVLVFGPNNFPLAFNGISGGDFAAAIAAGCPVIAKAHGLHPSTSRLLAEAAHEAAINLPKGTVQMLYGMSNEDGFRTVADPRLGAVAFTGSRQAGLALKQAADQVGTPFFAELSSINPVVLLPGALQERFDAIVEETVTSGLMGAGQFCTKPGLVLTLANDMTEKFVASVAERYRQASPGTLFSEQGLDCLSESVAKLCEAGAQLVSGGQTANATPFSYQNTLLRTSGSDFLNNPEVLQSEAFGNSMLITICDGVPQVCEILKRLEGSLTGCVYSATDGSEDDSYDQVAFELSFRVGRLLNDKMPTGVAVSPAMNHGGPYPSTGHPHFTAVGLPRRVPSIHEARLLRQRSPTSFASNICQQLTCTRDLLEVGACSTERF